MLDREEIARLEVGHTTVSPTLARVLVLWFLTMLALLPLTELVSPQGAGAWSYVTGTPAAIQERLQSLRSTSPTAGAWRQLVTANRAVLETLAAFENALEDQSAVGRALRPLTQRLLTAWLGAGNERVYIGRDGWLFYRPDVEYVTGRPFLDPRQMARRIASASEYEDRPQPDPGPAILQFQRDLDARGIALVLMPTPVKPTIHPEELSRRSVTGAPENASERALLEQLRRDGVLVFDPTEAIATAAEPQYLLTDTHWRPDTMQRTAEALATFVQRHVALPALAPAGYQAARREAQNLGDTAAMLDLPAEQTLYPPERVTLRYIEDAGGEPWRASRDADILLLGDSFSNMYSLASMQWGESAGFAEQLSYVLQRPIDRIVQNDQGAHATRALLARDLEEAGDRLAGKRVVIWQFAARELAFGDWKSIDLPPPGEDIARPAGRTR